MPTFSGFPGDPPVFDFLAEYGSYFSVVAASIWALVIRLPDGERSKLRRAVLRVAAVPLGLALLASGAGWAAVSQRHFGDWRPAKELIAEESRRIAAELGGSRRLEDAEYARYAAQLSRLAVSFNLGESVRVQPYLFYDYPYVGLDFGEGGVAIFHPATMLCIGSD